MSIQSKSSGEKPRQLCNLLVLTDFLNLLMNISFVDLREKIMTVPRKVKKREARREEKAEKAAVLDKVFVIQHFGISSDVFFPYH